MPTHELRPIREVTDDFDGLEAAIKELFKREVYYPVLALLEAPKQATLENALGDTAVTRALRSGRITYDRGSFKGRFGAEVSSELRRLGARWDQKTGTFKILQSTLPQNIHQEIQVTRARLTRRLERVDELLQKLLPEEITDKLKAAHFFDASLFKVDQDFKSTLKNITVAPTLTDTARKRISKEWETNMRLWVKDFAQEEILKLRKGIQKSALAGNRYEASIKTIQRSFGVTANKAKFLARQETALLMTKFKETRYTEAGVKEYVWGTVAGSKNHLVRPWHKDLEGKIFRWDDPPITTDVKGKYGKPQPPRRNNPGQDFNCRCFARPIVRFKKEA